MYKHSKTAFNRYTKPIPIPTNILVCSNVPNNSLWTSFISCVIFFTIIYLDSFFFSLFFFFCRMYWKLLSNKCVFYKSNWQSDLKSHISSLQLTRPSCCGSDRGNWVQTEKMKGQTTEASLGCYCDFLPQVPHSPRLPPSPSLKLSEAMCSLHYKGFCSRMRHPSLPSDVIFLHLPLTRS